MGIGDMREKSGGGAVKKGGKEAERGKRWSYGTPKPLRRGEYL